MFILGNGDVYEDEEILGDKIFDGLYDDVEIEDCHDFYVGRDDDERLEAIICDWEDRVM